MWFVFPLYLLVTCGYLVVTCGYLVVTCGYLVVTSGYLVVTCGYLVVTCGYLIATTGYFSLLLVTSCYFWFLVLVITEINLIFLIKPFFYMLEKSRQKFKYLEKEKVFLGEK